MPFPFGKSHKCPADIVKNLKDNMTILEKQDISDKKAEKVLNTFVHSAVTHGCVTMCLGLNCEYYPLKSVIKPLIRGVCVCRPLKRCPNLCWR